MMTSYNMILQQQERASEERRSLKEDNKDLKKDNEHMRKQLQQNLLLTRPLVSCTSSTKWSISYRVDPSHHLNPRHRRLRPLTLPSGRHRLYCFERESSFKGSRS